MKIKHITFLAILSVTSTLQLGFAAGNPIQDAKPLNPHKYYGAGLCETPGYFCVKINHGDSWTRMFPDERQRDIVQRINRTDLPVPAGTLIAVPKNLSKNTIYDVSPFPLNIAPLNPTNKLIIVDQDRLAWAAYDRDGGLVKWGPISSGQNYCPDIHRPCTSITGEFYVFNKQDGKCKSTIFPVDEGGGAVMPWCMFFYKGFALHGSPEVPGYRASHGCIRMFVKDAIWLNKFFVELPAEKNGMLGTKVVIQKLIFRD